MSTVWESFVKGAIRWVWNLESPLLCLTVIAVTILGYQVSRPIFVDVGSPYDGPWVAGFHAREGDQTFSWRWSTSEASINLPGVGAGWYTLSISMGAGERNTLPTVTLWVNGQKKAVAVVPKDQTVFQVHLTPRDFLAGDFSLAIASDTFVPRNDPRSLGVAVDWIRLEADRQVPVIPAFGVLTYAILVALGSLISLRVARVGPRASLMVLGLLGAVYGSGLALNRVEVGAFLPRLLTAVIFSAPIPIAVSALLSVREAGSGRAPKLPGQSHLVHDWTSEVPSPRPLWMQMIVAFAFLVSLAKIGGTLYPQIVIIDMPFHLAQIRQVLAGNFWKLYLPGSLSLAVMPEKEWTVRAPIPYSPFFYLFMTPLAWLPWDLRLTVPLLNAVLEAWKLPLVLFLGMKLGLDKPACSLGAVVYGLAGAMYMLLQWGNWPTTFSQWFALAGLTVLAGIGEISAKKGYWVKAIGGGILLFIAFISYTVTAAFLLTVLVIIGIMAVARRRASRPADRMWSMCIILLVAWIAAFIAYYSAHVYVALTQTLPAFASALVSQGTLTTRTATLSQYLASNVNALGNYGLTPIILLGSWGALLVWGRWRYDTKGLVLGWLGVLVLFGVVGFKVDMVLKHVWFTVPLMACLAGPGLLAVGRRGLAGLTLSVAFLSFLAWASSTLWTWRIWVASH